jgi:large conductance mechanosensitive channel
MSFLKEFKEFAMRGNVVDLAVGVIIGGAFGTIINSVVKDMIMPIVGIAGNVDFSNMYFGLTESTRLKIHAAVTQTDGKMIYPSLDRAREMGPVLAYGNFITVVINFVILALCIFMMVKAMNMAMRKPPPPTAAPPPLTKDQQLLTEIRDLMKQGA